MFGYPTESLEPHVRRCGHFDQYPEVRARRFDNMKWSVTSVRTDRPQYSLLNDPNTSSPANVEASNLYKDNRKEYIKRVRETVEKSWED